MLTRGKKQGSHYGERRFGEPTPHKGDMLEIIWKTPKPRMGAKRRKNREWEHKGGPKRGEGQGQTHLVNRQGEEPVLPY